MSMYQELMNAGLPSSIAATIGAALDKTPDAPTEAALKDSLVRAGVDVNAAGVLANRISDQSSVSGGGIAGAVLPQVVPYRVASFGDSRSNTSSATPDISGSGQILTSVRTPFWFCAYRGDCEFVGNYGVSGDTVITGAVGTGWDNPARTGGKTISALIASNIDVVYVQYGINDWLTWGGTTPSYSAQVAAVSGGIIALVTELIKAGKFVVYESINPIGLVSTPNAAQKMQGCNDTNDAVAAFLANFATYCAYVDTSAWTKDASGYANPVYYNTDAVHFIQNGAMRSGKECAVASFANLPRKTALFFGETTTRPNLVNLANQTVFAPLENGTIASGASAVISSGVDPGGWYHLLTWTPTGLTANNECKVRIEVHANVGAFGGAVPKYTLAGGESLRGRARVIVDDGAGGVPNICNLVARHRLYKQAGGSLFADGALFVNATTPTSLPNSYLEPVDVVMTCPPFTNDTASAGIQAPAQGVGYQYQLYVSSNQVGLPVRVKIYNPQLRDA